MELQRFINDNTDYISKFRKLNLIVKTYTELNLAIITYKRNINYDFKNNSIIKWCKGAVINTNNHKIISLSPPKCYLTYSFNNIPDIIEKDYILQPLIDGTMINMFYHNNQWMISTRSFIGAKNKWDQKISFKKMFDEAKNNMNVEELNKNHSYSFVLHHKNNRIISKIVENSIVLVDEYSFEGDSPVHVDFQDKYTSFTFVKNNELNVLKDSKNKSFNFQFKGFTIKNKNNNHRINIINQEYCKAFEIKQKCNYNNKLLTFIYLRKNNLLKSYLKYFDDDNNLFDNYRNMIYIMKNELHECYINHFIKKNIITKAVPYQLKPLIFELHRLFQNKKIKITNSVVNDYIYNMPEKKLCFVLNYYKTD